MESLDAFGEAQLSLEYGIFPSVVISLPRPVKDGTAH